MLERIREGSQGPWAMAIIVLIVLSFVFAGVSSYVSSSGVTAAAEVNGEEISQQDVERAYQSQRARLEAQFGESIGALFSDENYLRDFRLNVLDRLIADTLVLQKAEELGLRVSDKQIREAIVQMPEFQTAGTFDNERYLMLLRQNGFQPASFSDYMRQQMTREQLARAVSASDFALPAEVTLANALQQQTRNAEYLIVDSAPFASEVELTDEEVTTFYEANLAQFDTQEKVNIAYVVLSVDDLKGDVTVTDEEVEQYYTENNLLYKTAEERRVSHIIIEFGDDEAAAKAKAEALVAELANGADFATLAQENSDDTFTAENGGDLDFITAGMMDEAFDKAAFSLAQVGDVSDVVETEFGFHIIKLTDIKPEEVTPLAEVSEEIRNQLATDKATDRFYSLQNDMANLAFEVPDTLEDVAGVANKPVKETGLVSAQLVPAPLNVPAVTSRVFDPAFIEEGLNSDLIELDDDTIAFVRIAEHEPQRTQSLDEVRTRILAQLRAEKAQQAAADWATNVVEQIKAGETPSLELGDVTLSWESKEALTRTSGELPRALVETLFTLGNAAPDNIDIAELGSGDVGIVKVTGINQPEALSEDDSAALAQQIATANAQTGYQAFIDSLRNAADVKINL
ncbi:MULTISPECIES: SurA N-terminal domain-containing protein [Marisediminitalea]|jgi:peptidyl-prolyl cis-trans isomerase D|uniref:SurA N-terminal domain-containing protein n=1 Tax=Marisediminitalea TaxID=2662254 RepID=UPI0020CCB9BD|nr:SurA N-terminal domain-containing protein [Marisediminitalea aggregata]MCP3864459.1 peptidylprolyl isomerase [Aestuariibacter sp.]MCP4235649.1 peptidylprolyl isomerase [Aestuariibacter sp.]MCP4525740.1 peptidylprolyl isomerase [Aestuariibacter sp.]MCP4946562.1 peptidylprolyl isomerase [Aestuariibacter sp.]MCP5010729.1 peptidylprolyl isomerase [Aestuariibacter sp.]|tara:strand:- start:506 stop:2392 length:1887 start_codon:yes stop_codon:yes gene_type:complete